MSSSSSDPSLTSCDALRSSRFFALLRRADLSALRTSGTELVSSVAVRALLGVDGLLLDEFFMCVAIPWPLTRRGPFFPLPGGRPLRGFVGVVVIVSCPSSPSSWSIRLRLCVGLLPSLLDASSSLSISFPLEVIPKIRYSHTSRLEIYSIPSIVLRKSGTSSTCERIFPSKMVYCSTHKVDGGTAGRKKAALTLNLTASTRESIEDRRC